MLAKAHTRDSTQALDKLTTLVDGQRQIISDPPMIAPIEEVFADIQADAIYEQIRSCTRQVPAQPAIRPPAHCSSSSRWSRWPARWSGWAASAPVPGLC